MMLQLTLYTKENCSLCDKLKLELEAYQDQYPYQLHEVDITKDEALFEKYRFIIPVLKSNNDEISAPIDINKLVQFLANSD